METGKALEIVHGMAKRLKDVFCEQIGRDGEYAVPSDKVMECREAMNTVEDFIVNNFGDEDEEEQENVCACSLNKPMTLDEAIEHAQEKAGDQQTPYQKQHAQLAAWPVELKEYREINE